MKGMSLYVLFVFLMSSLCLYSTNSYAAPVEIGNVRFEVPVGTMGVILEKTMNSAKGTIGGQLEALYKGSESKNSDHYAYAFPNDPQKDPLLDCQRNILPKYIVRKRNQIQADKKKPKSKYRSGGSKAEKAALFSKLYAAFNGSLNEDKSLNMSRRRMFDIYWEYQKDLDQMFLDLGTTDEKNAERACFLILKNWVAQPNTIPLDKRTTSWDSDPEVREMLGTFNALNPAISPALSPEEAATECEKPIVSRFLAKYNQTGESQEGLNYFDSLRKDLDILAGKMNSDQRDATLNQFEIMYDHSNSKKARGDALNAFLETADRHHFPKHQRIIMQGIFEAFQGENVAALFSAIVFKHAGDPQKDGDLGKMVETSRLSQFFYDTSIVNNEALQSKNLKRLISSKLEDSQDSTNKADTVSSLVKDVFDRLESMEKSEEEAKSESKAGGSTARNAEKRLKNLAALRRQAPVLRGFMNEGPKGLLKAQKYLIQQELDEMVRNLMGTFSDRRHLDHYIPELVKGRKLCVVPKAVSNRVESPKLGRVVGTESKSPQSTEATTTVQVGE